MGDADSLAPPASLFAPKPDKKGPKTIAILFISVFILSALAYGIGYFTGNLSQGYHFARIFMGAAQSPFILLILLPAIKLSKLQNSI